MTGWRLARASVTLGVVLVTGAAIVSAADAIASHWREREIHIDGVNDDWEDTFYNKDVGTIGVVNDERYLYLSIVTSDQQRRRQFVAQGLIVWLDAKGGKKQSFGIELPGSRVIAGDARRRGPDEPPLDLPAPPLTYFELLGPKKDDRQRIELAVDSGIEVASGSREGALVYELKIPLAKTATEAYAIGTLPGRTIGLGLETPKPEGPQGSRPEGRGDAGGGGGFGGGGRGGYGGGRGGGRGGGYGGGGRQGPDGGGLRAQNVKPLKIWTALQLAAMATKG